MEIITGNDISIFAGDTEISEIFQGENLIWEKDSDRPSWPSPFYYPTNIVDGKGISFFYSNVSNGYSFNGFDMLADDCEGEGGGYVIYLGGDWLTAGRGTVYSFSTSKSYTNSWLSLNFGWDFYCRNYGNLLSGATGMALWAKLHSCGSYYELPTGITYTNIRLLVIPYFDSALAAPIREVIANCPNLMYLALDSAGTFSGETFTLTGSTNWTAESMKFTEWYCPNTTFIIENNSWWRSRIDWDIAAKRNITFKDPNGNIITQ